MPKPEDYMTVEECAAVVRMTPAGFRRLCSDGKIPCTKVGRRFLIRTSDFEAWLEAQSEKPKSVGLAGGRVHPGSVADEAPRPEAPRGDAPTSGSSGERSARAGGSVVPRVIG